MFNAVIHLSAKVKTAYEPEGGATGAAAPTPPPPPPATEITGFFGQNAHDSRNDTWDNFFF